MPAIHGLKGGSTSFARDDDDFELPAGLSSPTGRSGLAPLSTKRQNSDGGCAGEYSWALSPKSDAELLKKKSVRGLSSPTSTTREDIEQRRKTMRESAFENPITEVQALADALDNQRSLPFVDRLPWNIVVSADVVLNLIILGFEADLKCAGLNCKDTFPWPIFDAALTISGCTEVIVCLVALGPRTYFLGDSLTNKQRGNFLRSVDVVLVLSRVLDLALTALGYETGVKLISMLRILHLANLIKRLAPLQGFRELWLILSGLGEAMRAVSFVIFLLLLILWVFGIAMTILWGRQPSEDFNYSNSQFDKDDFWSTVPRSMLTLFEVFTKDRWAQVISRPLVEKNIFMAFFFSMFLVITVMSLSTTLVGVVIESALSSAQANEEKNGQEKAKFDTVVMTSLEQAFFDADEDQNGNLTRQELHRALEHGSVRGRLRLVDISVSDLDLLFTLLDEEGVGSIKTSSFFRSCLRLRGEAMARHTSQYMTDLVRHTKRCEGMEANVQIANNALGSVLDQLAVLDKEVIKSDIDGKDPVIEARRNRQAVPISQLLRHNTDHIARQEPFIPKHKAGRHGSNSKSRPENHSPPWGQYQPGPPPLPPHIQEEEEQQALAVANYLSEDQLCLPVRDVTKRSFAAKGSTK